MPRRDRCDRCERRDRYGRRDEREPGEAGPRGRNRLGLPPGARRVLLGGVLGAALTGVLLAVLWWPRSEVVHRTSAPASVSYPDDSPHHLGLVREHSLAGRDSWRLVVGRDAGLSYRDA